MLNNSGNAFHFKITVKAEYGHLVVSGISVGINSLCLSLHTLAEPTNAQTFSFKPFEGTSGENNWKGNKILSNNKAHACSHTPINLEHFHFLFFYQLAKDLRT